MTVVYVNKAHISRFSIFLAHTVAHFINLTIVQYNRYLIFYVSFGELDNSCFFLSRAQDVDGWASVRGPAGPPAQEQVQEEPWQHLHTLNRTLKRTQAATPHPRRDQVAGKTAWDTKRTTTETSASPSKPSNWWAVPSRGKLQSQVGKIYVLHMCVMAVIYCIWQVVTHWWYTDVIHWTKSKFSHEQRMVQ